jgi:hypothetical protein
MSARLATMASSSSIIALPQTHARLRPDVRRNVSFHEVSETALSNYYSPKKRSIMIKNTRATNPLSYALPIAVGGPAVILLIMIFNAGKISEFIGNVLAAVAGVCVGIGVLYLVSQGSAMRRQDREKLNHGTDRSLDSQSVG